MIKQKEFLAEKFEHDNDNYAWHRLYDGVVRLCRFQVKCFVVTVVSISMSNSLEYMRCGTKND